MHLLPSKTTGTACKDNQTPVKKTASAVPRVGGAITGLSTQTWVNECNGDLSSVVLARSSWVGPHVELALVFVGDPKSALLVKMAGGIYLYNRQRHGF